MASGTIKIYKGNIAAIPVNVSAADGSFSLAGVTMLFTVKLPTDSLSDDSAAVISKSITAHIDNTNSVIPLTESDTESIAIGQYIYDLKFYEAGVLSLNSDPGLFIVEKPNTYRDA